MQAMTPSAPLAILVNGGPDSAALAGESITSAAAVHPLYVRTGLAWEDVELTYLQRFPAAVAAPTLMPGATVSRLGLTVERPPYTKALRPRRVASRSAPSG